MTPADRPRLPVLIFLSALAVLPMNMFVPSLPAIAADLAADFAVVNISIAGYAAVTGVTHLFAGPLADRFGRKPVALAALAIFTVASIGCSLATSIGTFLLCRLLQGAVIAGYSVSLAAIRDTSSDSAAASRIGYVSSAWAIAPMVGPTLGGLLDELFGWRANFIAFAVLGIAGLCLAGFHLKETNRNPSASLLRLDGFRDLGRSGRFRAYTLCMAFSIGTLYAFIGGAPLVAALLHPEVSSTTLGVYMGIVPAGFLVGSYIVGQLGSRYSTGRFILAGRALTCLGLLAGFALYLAGPTHLLAFFGPCVCVGLGNGLTMPSANARVLSIRPDLAGTSAGLAATLTVAGASTIAFASGLIVTPSNAHAALLGVMLASSLLALAFGMAAVFLERATSRSDRRP